MGRKRYFEQNIDQQQQDNIPNHARNNYKHQSNVHHKNANHQPIQNFRGRGGRGGGRGANNSFRRNQEGFQLNHNGFKGRPYQGEYQGEDALIANFQGHAGPSRPHRGQPRGHIDGHKPWYRYGYGEQRYGVMTNSHPPAPPRMSEEELQYEQKNRKAIQNKIDEAKKDINNKIQVRSTVQQLKDKLSMRRRNQSDSSPNPTEEVNDYDEVEEHDVVEDEQEETRQETLAANMRFREPQMDLFDIEMSNRDFRDVGSGQITNSPEDSSDSVTTVNQPIRNAFRRSRSEDPASATPKRIANQLTRPKPKKRRVEVSTERYRMSQQVLDENIKFAKLEF